MTESILLAPFFGDDYPAWKVNGSNLTNPFVMALEDRLYQVISVWKELFFRDVTEETPGPWQGCFCVQVEQKGLPFSTPSPDNIPKISAKDQKKIKSFLEDEIKAGRTGPFARFDYMDANIAFVFTPVGVRCFEAYGLSHSEEVFLPADAPYLLGGLLDALEYSVLEGDSDRGDSDSRRRDLLDKWEEARKLVTNGVLLQLPQTRALMEEFCSLLTLIFSEEDIDKNGWSDFLSGFLNDVFVDHFAGEFEDGFVDDDSLEGESLTFHCGSEVRLREMTRDFVWAHYNLFKADECVHIKFSAETEEYEGGPNTDDFFYENSLRFPDDQDEFMGLFDLLQRAFDANEFSGFTYEYNDGAGSRMSGYYQSAERLCFEFDPPNAHEQIEASLRIARWKEGEDPWKEEFQKEQTATSS